jgi:hypothetical protein
MSFLVGYMPIIFAFYLWFDNEYFMQVLLLVVAACAVNPLSYLAGAALGARISDHVPMAVFIAVPRVSVLS